MVAAILIIPYIQRLKKGKSDQQKNNRPAQVTEQVTEQVDSAATTTANTTQNTTQVTTSSTEGISVFHKTARMLQVYQAKTLPTNATNNTTSKSVVTKNTTTTTKTTQEPITQITTTASYATTTKKTTITPLTDGTTGANNTPVETESYYPSPEEWDMFCVVVCSETGYCEDKAQLAVAHTVINRLSNPIYPDTIKEILTQRAQYTCVSNYYTGNMRPGLEIGGEAYNHTMQLVHQAWEEWDFTNGAVAYYNPHMIGWNAWFEQYECVYEDEYGRFFKV